MVLLPKPLLWSIPIPESSFIPSAACLSCGPSMTLKYARRVSAKQELKQPGMVAQSRCSGAVVLNMWVAIIAETHVSDSLRN